MRLRMRNPKPMCPCCFSVQFTLVQWGHAKAWRARIGWRSEDGRLPQPEPSVSSGVNLSRDLQISLYLGWVFLSWSMGVLKAVRWIALELVGAVYVLRR
jgi:hypothetical protein